MTVFWFILMVGLWLVFAGLLLADRGRLDRTWQSYGALPLIGKGVAWLLFFPWLLGLAVWEGAWLASGWSPRARLITVAVIAAFYSFVFFPVV